MACEANRKNQMFVAALSGVSAQNKSLNSGTVRVLSAGRHRMNYDKLFPEHQSQKRLTLFASRKNGSAFSESMIRSARDTKLVKKDGSGAPSMVMPFRRESIRIRTCNTVVIIK